MWTVNFKWLQEVKFHSIKDLQEYHECGVFVSVAYFWAYSTGCSDEFHVVFKHFQNFENLYVEHFEEYSCISVAL